ncbi:MAG: transcription elongation factor GreA [Candidatus Nealsonbacteria bacterium]|nr:MAG: transcription elongation factor GreA [Candidatus Nealsonbacteria bacterium]
MGNEKYYLTKEGLKKIEKEYKKLLKLKKQKSRGGAPSVLHSDELSAEFISYREDLDFLDSKIEELQHILKNYELIKPPPKKEKNKVHLGAQVKVEVDGQIDEFIIVGTLEANPTLGKISNESPVGKALLGHKVGDEVVLSSPVKVVYKIKSIKY